MVVIKVNGDTYTLDRLLGTGGKVRIKVNGYRAYEGMATAEQPARFAVRNRQYEIAKVTASTGKVGHRIRVLQGDQVVYEGVYNGRGIDINNPAQLQAAQAVQICAIVGFVFGLAFMIGGNLLTGVIPGGAIGGAIGGSGGFALGTALGKALFSK